MIDGITHTAHIIITEMSKGNFSFAILIVGVAQLVAMIRRRKD